MKLPENYFKNLTNSKYRDYLKLLPDMHKENNQLITTLIMTFFALTFFGIFAINPTLTTIVELEKTLEDSEFTHQQLSTKITHLSTLQQSYNSLSNDMPFIEEALPRHPDAPTLAGQIHTLTRESKLSIRNLRISQVQLAGGKKEGTKGFSYVFNLEAEGTYENMMQFADNATKFNRIVTVESISIGKDSTSGNLVMFMRGRQYFKP